MTATATGFDDTNFTLRREVFALAGKFSIYDSTDDLVLYSHQKLFKLREDIRIYADDHGEQEVMNVQAREILDFSAAYDVVDSTTGRKIGALRRRGFASMVQDSWEILDTADNVIGSIEEDNLGLALLRRFLVSLIPQKFNVTVRGRKVALFSQAFNPFLFSMKLEFAPDSESVLDRRLGLAAAIVIAAIEGRQD